MTERSSDLITWPEHHFASHRRRSAGFDATVFRTLLSLRGAAQRVENALGEWFVGVGVTPQKFGVLMVLFAEDASISLSDLRRFVGTTQANITGLVVGLEKDGFVRRETGLEDRRVSFVSLTGLGRETVTSHLPAYFDMNRLSMSALSHDEQRTLIELLAKMASGYAGDEVDRS